jgi:hypothetical protein
MFTTNNSAAAVSLSPATFSSMQYFAVLQSIEMNNNQLTIRGTTKGSCMYHLVTNNKKLCVQSAL